MANVVVIGGGLGGLPTAYELRHYLPKEHTVTLISDKAEFTFIPGLIRVALNLNSLDHIQLNLSQLTQRHGIKWVLGKVTALNPNTQQITVEDGQKIYYDYLAIAVGSSLAFDEIPGLGPHGGYTQSVCTPEHALEAKSAWLEFLENPGDLVVGAMPGAGCFAPAYEFVLMADQELRRHGIRDKVNISYITPEPYVGHTGVRGLAHAQELSEGLMAERGIKTIVNAQIVDIQADKILLADGSQFPFKYSMILPSHGGVKFLREAHGLTNEKGFIPVLPSQKHPNYPSIYALGTCVDLKQPEKTLLPIGLPKSGQMTEAMGVAVAHNIAVELGAIDAPLTQPTLEALCFAEYGNTGIAYIAAPVLPNPDTGKRRFAYAVRGRWVNWVKAAFEEYFLLKMRTGLGMPWFEKLGLRVLFGLSMLQSIPLKDKHQLGSST